MGLSNQIGASSLIKPGVVDSAAARPASPYEGQVIFQKDTDQLLVWNGTAWVIPNSPAQNPQGLELVTTTTCSSGGTASGGVVTFGSAQSSVVIATAFSSTYDNYKIVITGAVHSNPSANFFLALSGITSGYATTCWFAVPGTNTYSADSSTSYSSGWIGLTGNPSSHSVEMWGPYQAISKSWSSDYTARHSSSYLGKGMATNASTTQSTGFTLSFSSGTVTGGTLRVYGYRNS